jgi:ribonuclease P protein component
LFSKGERIVQGQLVVLHQQHVYSSLHYGVSVPKKRVPLAVDRNRMKRQLREAIRLYIKQKPELLSLPVAFFLLYVSAEGLSFDELQMRVNQLLDSLFEANE